MTVDCTAEQWREIPGYEGIYEVSTEGRVRLMIDRGGRGGGRWLKGHVFKEKPCRAKVYRVVELTNPEGKKQTRKIHQLVMAAFVGPRPEVKWQINHRDGNPTNNHICNLEYCTPSENQKHRVEVLGKRQTYVKLTEEQVLDIRARLAAGTATQAELAREYKVNPVNINSIYHRRHWKHI